MCGFSGVLRFDGGPVDSALLERMNEVIVHRGPDGGAIHTAPGIGLANRRLAILDLSDSAALPMTRGDLTIAYNGEFYAFAEERERLAAAGHTFTTRGDTEVILALYREHGPEFVDHLSGMFAFALWDETRRTLLLGRDAAGKKPLYYYRDDEVLVFGSELKSLLQHPAVPRRARCELLPLVLAYGYVPTPDTCFAGIHTLPPGQLLVATPAGVTVAARTYGQRLVSTGGTGEAGQWTDRLLATLREAVRVRLVSDVPLGAFLSGGLDSSLIVALMSELTSSPPKTFSIGFEGEGSWDETAHAERVAQQFGTEHIAFRVAAPHVPELLPELVWYHDQPFGDSSAIPMLLLSRLAREHVTVALSGDAGDELFAGYERFHAARLASYLHPVRGLLEVAASVAGRCGQGAGYRDRARRIWEFADGARQPLPDAYFRWVRIATDETLAALCNGHREVDPTALFRGNFDPHDPRDWVSRILDVNYRTYLLDDLLVKADRMTMAASLEVRAPFLDAAMVRLASEMPTGLKLRGGVTKYVLKEAARQLLPADIVDRRKHGFGVPLGDWFRNGLRDYVRELLLSRAAADRGLFRREGIERLIDEHQDGRRNHGHLLWTLCTIEHWFRLYVDAPRVVKP